MRPSLSEQLDGMRRVLADVVAPEIDGAYPADILTGALGTLEALAAGWADVPAFLQWDGEETARLLGLAGATAAPQPTDVLDLRALEAWHQQLRADLERAVPDLLAGPHAEELTAHMRARADRFPIRPVQRMPGQK